MKKSSLLALLGLFYALNTNAQTVSTEENIPLTHQRRGFSLIRGKADFPTDIGDVTARYDAFTNLSPSDSLSNVAGLFVSNTLKKDGTSITRAGYGFIDIGNPNKTSALILNPTGNNELFLDAWISSEYVGQKAKLEIGTSLRQASIPRHFFMTTLEDVTISSGLKTMLEYGYFTKDPLQNEGADRSYALVAAYTNNVFASAGNELHNQFYALNINNLKDFGILARCNHWANGSWMARLMASFDDVDTTFYNNSFTKKDVEADAVPSFFGLYRSTPVLRANETLDATITGDDKTTTARIIGGVKINAPYIGKLSLGVGPITNFSNSTSKTGYYITAYKDVSIGGFTAALEFNDDLLHKDITMHAWASYAFGGK